MFKKYSANGTVLFVPRKFTKDCSKLLLQERCAFITQAIYEALRAALVVIVELRAGALQIAVVIEQLQSPQKLLRAATEKRNDLRGTEKAMSVNHPDDFAVALRQLHGSNPMGAFEAGKAERFHLPTLPRTTRRRSGHVLPSATSWLCESIPTNDGLKLNRWHTVSRSFQMQSVLKQKSDLDR